MTKVPAVAIALATLLFAELASACPVCAGRGEAGTLRWVALGLLVISPWIVVSAVVLYIRRTLQEARRDATATENMP